MKKVACAAFTTAFLSVISLCNSSKATASSILVSAEQFALPTPSTTTNYPPSSKAKKSNKLEIKEFDTLMDSVAFHWGRAIVAMGKGKFVTAEREGKKVEFFTLKISKLERTHKMSPRQQAKGDKMIKMYQILQNTVQEHLMAGLIQPDQNDK